MTDHALLVPTSRGPVGAVVSEPDGVRRAALALLQGGGRGGRAGVNAVWTGVARRLSELGLVVLRVDYSLEGDSHLIGPERGRDRAPGWKGELDLELLREVIPWFRARAGGLDLFLAGSCYGGRLAMRLAAEEPALAGSLLIVPYLRSPEGRSGWRARLRRVRSGGAPGPSDVGLDPKMVEVARRLLARAPGWALVGEKDAADVESLKRVLGSDGASLEIETVPDVALYPVHYPQVQDEVSRRLVQRLERALTSSEALA